MAKNPIIFYAIKSFFCNFGPVNDILKKESPKFFKTTGN